MKLTPRQAAAYLEFSSKIDRAERQSDLVVTAVGSQGDKKAIEKLAKELSR